MLADDEREDYMKKIIITMFLVLTGPFGIQLTHASQGALEGATEFCSQVYSNGKRGKE